MQTRTEIAASRRGHWKSWLLCPLVALAAYSGTGERATAAATMELAAAASTAPGRTTYSVINLSPLDIFSTADINAKGQVAFDVFRQVGVGIGKFYDGKTVLDTGLIFVSALNDRGQVVGSANVPETGALHAYLWSKSTGVVDLRTLGPPPGESAARDINNKGQVVGISGVDVGPGHAVLWIPGVRILDLGTLGGLFSEATAINDAGQVTGVSQTAGSSTEAFIWTKANGMRGIGTLGGGSSRGTDINAGGEIAGASTDAAGTGKPFFWSPQQGMIGIGEGGFANDLNDKGMVVGVETISGQDRAFAWTRGTGVIYLGTFGGASSVAVRVNNRGHVVGSAQAPDGARAFVWSRADGLVDLNTRIPDAPAGLVLTFARAISDNGAIVASSNAGLVLLVPRPFAHAAPVVGPVNVTGTSRINATQSFSASFKDADLRDTHKATWSWGDGSKDAGTVSERNGTGSVSSQHTYRAPGIYTVRLTVTDSSGTSATVQRTVVVCSGSLSPT